MVEEKPNSISYRQKAAELRAAAERTFNRSIRVELLNAADTYDRLAEFVEKQSHELASKV